jgi:hypothetical protein
VGGVALDYLKMSIDADPFGFALKHVESEFAGSFLI